MSAEPALRYVRVVLAVRDDGTFADSLDAFIEGTEVVHGAYVAEPVAERTAALGADWRDAGTPT